VSTAKPLLASDLLKYREREENDSALYTTTLWTRALDPSTPGLALPEQIIITPFVSDRVKPGTYMGYDIHVEIPIRSLLALDPANGKVLWTTAGTKTAGGGAAGAGAGGIVAKNARQIVRRAQEHPEGDDDDWADAQDDESDDAPGFPRGRGGRLGGLDDDENFRPRDFSYITPAVVRDGRVIAGGWIQRGNVNNALRCHDLATGDLLWETLIACGNMESTLFGETAREPFAGAILEDGGIVYYASQVGAVAAVDAVTGRLLWLSTYETLPIRATFQRQAERRSLVWGPNPMLLLGRTLVVTPRDSDYLYIFDTGQGPGRSVDGGRVLWRYRNETGPLEMRDLLGSREGRRLYFTGSSAVSALEVPPLDLPLGAPRKRAGHGAHGAGASAGLPGPGNHSRPRGADLAGGSLCGRRGAAARQLRPPRPEASDPATLPEVGRGNVPGTGDGGGRDGVLDFPGADLGFRARKEPLRSRPTIPEAS
jgi:outer membrane protein assembly factor BamB